MVDPKSSVALASSRVPVGVKVRVRTPAHLLSQALANLIDNALKYGAGDIVATVRREAGGIIVEVADRGPGIPERDRESVFDRFVRLEPSRSTPGNGLGLSLVRAVARRHGAWVKLEDNNPGLRATIAFPAAPAAAQSLRSRSGASAAA